MQIEDVMTRGVETISPNATLKEAAEKMRDQAIGALPVVEAERLVGMLTDRDITVRATAEGRDPKEVTVAEVMTEGVVTVGADEPIEVAEQLMESSAVRRLVVVDPQGRPAGMLSLDDLAALAGASAPIGDGRLILGMS